MNSLVSILIPCFNAEKWIAETLESAISQTYQNKEIIVIDDGSTDDSLAIAKAFESPILKVISQENQGAGIARNRGLREAQGDFIQYLDADDLLASNKIELQLQVLHDSEFVAAGEWARFFGSPLEAIFVPEPVWNNLSPVDWLVCSWDGGGMMHPAAWLIPRNVSDAVGPWNEEDLSRCPNDDGEYFCRVVLASQGVQFCSGAKSYYRSGIFNSLSNKRSTQAIVSIYQSLEFCTGYLLNKEDSRRTRRACANLFQRFIYSIYPDSPELVEQAEANISALGGTGLKPPGGSVFQTLANILGWKIARQLQKAYQRRKL